MKTSKGIILKTQIQESISTESKKVSTFFMKKPLEKAIFTVFGTENSNEVPGCGLEKYSKTVSIKEAWTSLPKKESLGRILKLCLSKLAISQEIHYFVPWEPSGGIHWWWHSSAPSWSQKVPLPLLNREDFSLTHLLTSLDYDPVLKKQ